MSFRALQYHTDITMDMLSFIFLAVLVSLSAYSNGEGLGSFIQDHMLIIEEHIMTGSGGALRNCDILSLSPQLSHISKDTPQWAMELKFLATLDIKVSFA